MTEFEKWLDKNCRGAGVWTTAGYKKGWKAALEWVLKKTQEHYPDDWDAYDLIKDIQKELTPTQSQNQSDNKPTDNPD